MAARPACPGCAMNDDHPRHTLVTAEGNIASWHTDCHKDCPVCSIKREGAEGLTGDAYRDHLIVNADELAAAVAELPEAVHNQVFGS